MLDTQQHPAAVASGLTATFNELCEAQDAALVEVMAIAKLARHAMDSDAPDAVEQAGFALDAIARLTAAASAALDEAQIDVGDMRARGLLAG